MTFAKKFFIYVLIAGLMSAMFSIARAIVGPENLPPNTIAESTEGILKVEPGGTNVGVHTPGEATAKFVLSGNIKADGFDGPFSNTTFEADQVVSIDAFGSIPTDYAFPRSLTVGVADPTGQKPYTLSVHGNITALDAGTGRAEINVPNVGGGGPSLNKTWTLDADFNAGTFSIGMEASDDELKLKLQ
jgi:hypothetical protein